MNLNQFYKELGKFDWYYYRSDDNRVYMAGMKRWDELKALADEIPGGPALMADYLLYSEGRGEKPPEPPDVVFEAWCKMFDEKLKSLTDEELLEYFPYDGSEDEDDEDEFSEFPPHTPIPLSAGDVPKYFPLPFEDT